MEKYFKLSSNSKAMQTKNQVLIHRFRVCMFAKIYFRSRLSLKRWQKNNIAYNGTGLVVSCD